MSRLRLEKLEERALLATFTVDSAADSGAGTLRAALDLANADSNPDTIAFAIPGAGVHTINLATNLVISQPVTINGYTQGLAKLNTLGAHAGTDAELLIELRGTGGLGLFISGNGSSISGLAINGFGEAIGIAGNGNHIHGNFIGTNVAGTSAQGTTSVGIQITGDNNIIGVSDANPSAAQRNIISNAQNGVIVRGVAVGNVIAGNLIGTNAAGTAAIPNSLFGVSLLLGADETRIGAGASGAQAAAANALQGNVISGNGFGGIIVGAQSVVTVPVTDTLIYGNYIGTDVTGTLALDNGNGTANAFGVGINSALGTIVGGTTPELQNIIAFNDGFGIAISSAGGGPIASGNLVRGNSIHSNTGLGIDLNAGGVLANDVDDVDGGTNARQNYPVITSVGWQGNILTLRGTFDSTINTDFAFDLYASPFDQTGRREGKVYLGSDVHNTGDGVSKAFEITIDVSGVAGQVFNITATATNNTNSNTSEFSAPVPVVFATGGNDSIEVRAGSAIGQVEIIRNGVSLGQQFQPTAPLVFVGGDGEDEFMVTASIAAGLVIDSGDGGDSVTIQLGSLAGPVTVSDSGTTGDDDLRVNGTGEADEIDKTGGTIAWNSSTEVIHFANIEQVTVDGANGNDIIKDPGENTLLLGGEGDDTIIVNATFGTGVAVDGGEGSDTVIVELGDLLGPVTIGDSGTSGVDSVIVVGTSQPDVIGVSSTEVNSGAELVTYSSNIESLLVNAGEGDDTLTIESTGTTTVVVDGQGGTDTYTVEPEALAGSVSVEDSGAVLMPVFIDALGNAQITGGIGQDTIIVTADANGRLQVRINNVLTKLTGFSGDIYVYGQAGNDKITVSGKAAAKVFAFGGEGNDYIATAGADDLLDGGEGNDRLLAGQGHNRIFGGAGNDTLQGGAGEDYLDGGPDNDKVSGVGGNDILIGGDGQDNLNGGPGQDYLVGGSGNDTLGGEAGDDILVGGAGNDKLYGRAGRDVLIGGLGADTLYGAGGEDLLLSEASSFDEQSPDAISNTLRDVILATWISSLGLQARVDSLTSLFDATTSDGASDSLYGEGNDDWFLFVASNDKAKDLKPTDKRRLF